MSGQEVSDIILPHCKELKDSKNLEMMTDNSFVRLSSETPIEHNILHVIQNNPLNTMLDLDDPAETALYRRV